MSEHEVAITGAGCISALGVHLDELAAGAEIGRDLGLTVNAGHGLTYNNVADVVQCLKPHELHIGHSIVSRAIFTGIREAVRQMKDIIRRAGR